MYLLRSVPITIFTFYLFVDLFQLIYEGFDLFYFDYEFYLFLSFELINWKGILDSNIATDNVSVATKDTSIGKIKQI